MRKLFLLGMLFAATTGFSQIVIWNGEDKESGSDGGFWGRADATVVEEGGNKCLKITTKANPNPEVCAACHSVSRWSLDTMFF